MTDYLADADTGTELVVNVASTYDYYLIKVTRVTRTQVICENVRISGKHIPQDTLKLHKSDGHMMGNGGDNNILWAYKVDDDLLAMVKMTKKRNMLKLVS